jgi:tetratricopeptide (TPR) repeat protein
MTKYCLIFLTAILLFILMTPAFSQDILEQEKELYLMTSDTVKANVLISLGKYYCSRDFEKALLYLQEALVISTEHNYKKGVAGSYLYQGRSYYYKDQYGISFDYLEKARKIFEEIDDQKGLANYYFAAGTNNAIIGNLINATENFQAVVTLSSETSNKELQCLGYISLGSLHIRRGEPVMAMSYLNEALELAKECDDSSLLANVMTNIGQTYKHSGLLDSALYFMNQGIELRTHLHHNRGVASSGLIIGELLIQMEQYQDAIDILESSGALYKELLDDTGISIAMIRKAEALAFAERKDQAFAAAYEALTLTRNIGNPSLIGDTYAMLATIHAHFGNFNEAYDYTLMLNTIRDSLAEANKERIISELEVRFQTARKDDRIMLLEAQNEVQHKNNILLTVSIAALGAILLLILILYRSKIVGLRRQRKLLEQEQTIRRQESELKDKEQQLLKEQLEAKNRELASKALEMLRLNETIESIIEKLEDHSRNNHNNENPTRYIRGIISGLESQLKNNSWNEFEKIFNNIHSKFFTILLETCPDLTPTEIRIAALLKLNLNTKEIAALTYKSEAGVKSTRYRLRKKLQLNSDDSLIPYLMQL